MALQENKTASDSQSFVMTRWFSKSEAADGRVAAWLNIIVDISCHDRLGRMSTGGVVSRDHSYFSPFGHIDLDIEGTAGQGFSNRPLKLFR
jgi:hypothetical protein